MTHFLDFLKSLPPISFCSPYQHLSKKDDDLSAQKVQDWIRANPIVPNDLRNLDQSEINATGKKLIQGLKQFHVDSSSEELVKEHLQKFCEYNCHIRRYLYDHLNGINADKQTIIALKDHICQTFPVPT